MYVHSFYRAGPVMARDIRDRSGNVGPERQDLGLPVYKLLGGPNDPPACGYTRQRENLDDCASCGVGRKPGNHVFQGGFRVITNDRHLDKINAAIKHTKRRGRARPDIDVAGFPRQDQSSVASIIAKEVEPLNLLGWRSHVLPRT